MARNAWGQPRRRVTYEPTKFLGLSASEWGLLNSGLALILLMAIGLILLPTLGIY